MYMRAEIQITKSALDAACVELGFCIPEKEAKRIVNLTEITEIKFAEEVLRAEGMIPEYERKWVKELAAIYSRFREKVGLN